MTHDLHSPRGRVVAGFLLALPAFVLACRLPHGSADVSSTCYRLEVTEWTGGHQDYKVPPVIALDTNLVPGSARYTRLPPHRLRPDMGGMRYIMIAPFWTAERGDTIRLVWSTGFFGYEMAFGPEVANSRVGSVAWFSDARGYPQPSAKLTAHRASCALVQPDSVT